MKMYNALSTKMVDTKKQLADQAGRMDVVQAPFYKTGLP